MDFGTRRMEEVCIEKWYFKNAFDKAFSQVEHEVFLKPELQIIYICQNTHLSKTPFSVLGFIKYSLTSSALKTFVSPFHPY